MNAASSPRRRASTSSWSSSNAAEDGPAPPAPAREALAASIGPLGLRSTSVIVSRSRVFGRLSIRLIPLTRRLVRQHQGIYRRASATDYELPHVRVCPAPRTV